MRTVKPSQDIRSLAEFAANVDAFVEQVQLTKRPLILTQHGRTAAVLLNVEAYEGLVDHVELQQDVRTAEAQIAAGQGVAHGNAHAEVRARLRLRSRA